MKLISLFLCWINVFDMIVRYIKGENLTRSYYDDINVAMNFEYSARHKANASSYLIGGSYIMLNSFLKAIV